MKFNIIFPMAGESSRFNYNFKPFLQISDSTFLELAFKYFKFYSNNINIIYFVVTKKQYDNNNVKNKIAEIFESYKYKIIILSNKTDNQYETIKKCIISEKINGSCFICDCDHSINISPMMNYLDQYDILIPIWDIKKENRDSWGKIYLNKDNNNIIKICEKETLEIKNALEYGLIGCYFLKNVEIILDYNTTSLSSFVREAFLNKTSIDNKIKCIEIKSAEFFGDPHELRKTIDNRRNKMTIFCDIDGTIIFHEATPSYKNEIILNSVIEKFNIWKKKGIKIILTTTRSNTKKLREMLLKLNIEYDDIITNLPSGPRILINDMKPSLPFTLQTIGINLERNKGLEEIDLSDILKRDKIIKKFKGGSFSGVYLIRREDKFFVRKIIYKNKKNMGHYNKLKLQYFNIKRFNTYCSDICPNIIDENDNNNYYYFDIIFLEKYKLITDIEDKDNILMTLFNKLNQEIYCMKKYNKNKKWLQNFMEKKINIDKYEKLSENIKKIINMDEILINGIRCKGLKQLLKNNFDKFNPKFLAPIHGDLTYENIMYNNYTKDVKLIDLDGGDYIDAIELDFGKLLQSEISKYELWSEDNNIIRNIDYNNNIIDTKEYINIKKLDSVFHKYIIWKDILEITDFYEFKQVGIFYMVIHLLRMIPYRYNKSENQTIYAIKESIFWMNYLIQTL
ncbi:MAG: hypothetical protein CL678_05530 [Bdellovibrionaceae bacterium]|nr:hypothetical protein [Pseudobdellovibrionaceae bacterium]